MTVKHDNKFWEQFKPIRHDLDFQNQLERLLLMVHSLGEIHQERDENIEDNTDGLYDDIISELTKKYEKLYTECELVESQLLNYVFKSDSKDSYYKGREEIMNQKKPPQY